MAEGDILNGTIPGVKVIVTYVNARTTTGGKTGRIRKLIELYVDVLVGPKDISEYSVRLVISECPK